MALHDERPEELEAVDTQLMNNSDIRHRSYILTNPAKVSMCPPKAESNAKAFCTYIITTLKKLSTRGMLSEDHSPTYKSSMHLIRLSTTARPNTCLHL